MGLGAVLALASPTPAAAQTEDEITGRDPAYEQEIYDRLEQINPAAVTVFRQATFDMDRGNFVAARQGFEQVLDMAEDFPDAARRLSSVEIALGDVVSALSHAELAYAADPNAYNRSSLAYALLATGLPVNLGPSLEHAQGAADQLPDDPFAQYVLALSAYANEEVEALDGASQAMMRLFPDDPLGHFFAGIVAVEQERWLDAEAALLRAQELGMPAEDVQAVLDSGLRAQARIQRGLRWGGYGLAGWAGGLVLLFVAGQLLSSATLRTVTRVRQVGQEAVSALERVLRAVYRAVITLTSAYFYVSIPLLIMLVIGLTAAVYYLFFVIGRIPLRLAFLIGVAALYTIYAIVRSILARVEGGDPGRPLTRDEAPRLWSVCEEVAKRLRTDPIEAVFITPGTGIGVLERGGALAQVRGAGTRTLLLGLGALPGMTQGQFRAILAHEYGHFAHRDTAGGKLAQRVKLSINQLALRLALAGQARLYNPAWLFVNGFYRIFLRVTLGASRLQEILADRYAALAYGSQEMADGLRHIIGQSLAFNLQVSQEIGKAQQAQRQLSNLYTLPPLEPGSQQDAYEAELAKLMERPTSVYDSHPAPKQRLELLAQIQARSPSYGDEDPVWELIPRAEALQQEMTEQVRGELERAEASAPA